MTGNVTPAVQLSRIAEDLKAHVLPHLSGDAMRINAHSTLRHCIKRIECEAAIIQEDENG